MKPRRQLQHLFSQASIPSTMKKWAIMFTRNKQTKLTIKSIEQKHRALRSQATDQLKKTQRYKIVETTEHTDGKANIGTNVKERDRHATRPGVLVARPRWAFPVQYERPPHLSAAQNTM